MRMHSGANMVLEALQMWMVCHEITTTRVSVTRADVNLVHVNACKFSIDGIVKPGEGRSCSGRALILRVEVCPGVRG